MASVGRDQVEDFVYHVFMSVRNKVLDRPECPTAPFAWIEYEHVCMEALVDRLAEMAKPKTEG